jgi:hypothetical protein
MTPGTNIPSANMHKRGIHFVESIAGLGSNPKGPEMDLDEMDPQRNQIFGLELSLGVGVTTAQKYKY